jgi:hypothetical protein
MEKHDRQQAHMKHIPQILNDITKEAGFEGLMLAFNSELMRM